MQRLSVWSIGGNLGYCRIIGGAGGETGFSYLICGISSRILELAQAVVENHQSGLEPGGFFMVFPENQASVELLVFVLFYCFDVEFDEFIVFFVVDV